MASGSPLSKANTTFGLTLMKKMCDDGQTDKNYIGSAFNVSTTLAMLLLGARGNTQKQIAQVMEHPDFPRSFHQSFGELRSSILKKNLHSFDRLFGEKTYNFIESFQRECRAIFGAELEPVDFINHAEKARNNINQWVDKETNGKVKDLLAKGSVDRATKMVVVDVTYFEAEWEQPFNGGTTAHKFWINETKWEPVKMMHVYGNFRYEATKDNQTLELPYKGGDFSMIIVLPVDKLDGLKKVRSGLASGDFKKRIDGEPMPMTQVVVSVPHFTIEQKLQMKDTLKGMGMVDAFDPAKSDFSGMSPREDFAVSDIVQQLFINVNETGTSAGNRVAAVTEMASDMEQGPEFKLFVADRPFLFYILHNPSSTLLFLGKFLTPK